MLNQIFNLQGRVALITGGSKGIGKAIARALAEAGADIAISARHEEELKTAAAEIRAGLDRRVEYRVSDMHDRADVDAQAKWALDTFGRVDILFNNAGSNQPQPLVSTTDESWDYILELNVTNCMRLARALVPQMI
ncbi:MAG TPA: SDR family oxidoreductase, partial [Pirellulaceae bacterium]|nr:SDR family oxidoreductase [Pirellulaceae bacterium]